MGLDKCIITCIHPFSIIQNSLDTLKIPCIPSSHPSLSLNPWQPLVFLCFFLLFFFLNFYLFIFLFLAVLGPRFCARALSSCGKWGPLLIAVHGPLTAVASLAAEHKLQTHRLSNCVPRAQLLRGMWDPPRPGLEPVPPASAGRLSTAAPPGKPTTGFF